VDQIYKYRLRTAQYDTMAPLPNDDPDAEPVSPKMREIMARLKFVETCQKIYSFAISTEVSKGGALQMGQMAKLQTQYPNERKVFLDRLLTHVKKNHYHTKPTKGDGDEEQKSSTKASAGGKKGSLMGLPFKKKNKVAVLADNFIAEAGEALQAAEDAIESAVEKVEAAAAGVAGGEAKDEGGGDELGAKITGGIDNLISPIAIESYIDKRARHITSYLEVRAPIMSWRSTCVEFISMLANTSGAVLAVLEYGTWVSITVAVGAVAMAIADYFYIGSQLAATNRALEESHNMLIWWDSLSLVQRKKRSCKLQCATVIEGSILNLISARTGVSPALPSEGGDDEEG